jgi:2',3'-cyclic-nucleotide 2'-phosphodiesterase (5'-nucleotidase family)
VVGVSEVQMPAYYPGTTDWKVRVEESSLGDFMADAIRWKTGADIAVVNGGGCRADINEGTLIAADIIQIAPWIQQVGVIEVSGQQILNSLEISVAHLPNTSGWFLQVSGITFEADTSIESPVVVSEQRTLDHIGDGKRRVSNVKIGGEPIDPDRLYTMGSVLFVLQEGGAGQSELSGCRLVSSDYPSDTEILVEYVKEALNGKITKEQYGNPDGDGRIIIRNETAPSEAAAAEMPAAEAETAAETSAVSEPAPHHAGELSVWGMIIVAFAGIIGIYFLVKEPKKK